VAVIVIGAVPAPTKANVLLRLTTTPPVDFGPDDPHETEPNIAATHKTANTNLFMAAFKIESVDSFRI
jgi:hypothetical protein